MILPQSYVIIHHSLTADSGTVSWGAIRRYHIDVQKWRDIGYHFGVEMIGDHVEVFIGRMMTEPAAAVKEEHMNTRGVHICAVGNYDLGPPPKEIWDRTVELAAFICRLLNIPAANVEGHHKYAPYKSCPGTKWDMDRFRAYVANNLKGEL